MSGTRPHRLVLVATSILPALACAAAPGPAVPEPDPGIGAPAGPSCTIVSVTVLGPDRPASCPGGRPSAGGSDETGTTGASDRLGRHRRRLLQCYADALVRDPTLQGTVELRIVSPTAGELEVEIVEADEALVEAGVVACMLERLRRALATEGAGFDGVSLPVYIGFGGAGDEPGGSGAQTTAPDPAGPLSQEGALGVVQGGQTALLECFRTTGGDASGPDVLPVRLEMAVAHDGELSGLAVAAEPPLDPGFEGCLRDVVLAWRFPASSCGAHVQVRLWFQPR